MADRAGRFNAAVFFVDRHLVEDRGARIAFRHGGAAIDYRALAADVSRTGHALAALGLEMEQRVLVVLEDRPAFAHVFWGAAKLGAVAVPVSAQLTREEYAFLLEDSRARVAVVEPALASVFTALQRQCPSLRAVVSAGPAGERVPGLGALAASRPAVLEPAPTHHEDAMYWGYTSGSTGRPRAAIHAHADFVAAADLVGIGVFGLGPDDLVFSVSKLHFAFGLGNTLYFPARVGAAALLVPERPGPARAFEIIATEHPTALFAVPAFYARMLGVEDAERRWDLSSLRLCVSSGEPLPPAIFDAWRARFGLPLVDVVGSTEALHDFIANRPEAPRRGSSGLLVPGFEARLVDDEGREVERGAVGQLAIRGATTASAYWRRREQTQATMRGGWLWTGDMFSRDADGYFYFAGRTDDMLKVAGQWVSPAEIEAQLLAHPSVLEAAVVGRPAPDGLTRPHAFVVLKDGEVAAPGLERRLRAFVRRRLGGFRTPRWVDVVDELPKTTTGKIQRFRLRPEAAPAPPAG